MVLEVILLGLFFLVLGICLWADRDRRPLARCPYCDGTIRYHKAEWLPRGGVVFPGRICDRCDKSFSEWKVTQL